MGAASNTHWFLKLRYNLRAWNDNGICVIRENNKNITIGCLNASVVLYAPKLKSSICMGLFDFFKSNKTQSTIFSHTELIKSEKRKYANCVEIRFELELFSSGMMLFPAINCSIATRKITF